MKPSIRTASKLFQPGAAAVSKSRRSTSVGNSAGHSGGTKRRGVFAGAPVESPAHSVVQFVMLFKKMLQDEKR